MFKKYNIYIFGFLAGLLNGFFGSGGGIIIIPILEYLNVEKKSAHATSVAITLIFSIITALMYIFNNLVKISDILIYLPMGILGCLLGSKILIKIPDKIISNIFALIIIISGIRLILK